MTSTLPDRIAGDYLATWNAPDETERLRLLDGWTHDARYTDPSRRSVGRSGIAAMMGTVRERFPGYAFALAGTPDGHGLFVRVSWTFASRDGDTVAHGTDVMRLDGSGHIAEVIGFLDAGAS